MTDRQLPPVFIHSLFRAGSTWLFQAFRRSPAGYWCYQEPLNEKLVHNARQPGGLRVGASGASEALRHPEMELAHGHEFHVVADELLRLFQPDFPYELFFEQDRDRLAGLLEYFRALAQGARGRPVFQCCRTTGRVAPLKEALGGIHLFLNRNPWDQWWSYKTDPYFESRNLFILGGEPLPGFLRELKKELGVPELRRVGPVARRNFFANRRLDAAGAYRLFYALWCHARLEAEPLCHMMLDIDRLSSESAYRDETLTGLDELGVPGLDFSDCAVPMTTYGDSDGRFFRAQEERVHELLLAAGYAPERVEALREQSRQRLASLVDSSLPGNQAVRDAMRAREQVLRLETQLSEMQAELFNTRGRLQQTEAFLNERTGDTPRRH